MLLRRVQDFINHPGIADQLFVLHGPRHELDRYWRAMHIFTAI